MNLLFLSYRVSLTRALPISIYNYFDMISLFAGKLVVILSWIFVWNIRVVNGEDPLLEWDLTIEERVQKHGYPIRTHQIETDDGYYNSLYNIPYGLNGKHKDTKNKSNVLIAHGMGGSPHNFIVLGVEGSAPYYFANKGLNVWLFAARGSDGSFQKKHKFWDWEKDTQYWNYCMHEIGKYDLAAAIDFIYNQTGNKVAVVGHSAGGNELHILLSERPEYSSKMSVGINWGSSPIIRLLDSPLWLFGTLLVDIWKAIAKYGNFKEVPRVQTFRPVLKKMCSDPGWQKVCTMTTWVIGSQRSRVQHPDVIRLLTSNIPRLSSRMVFQFCDNINAGVFSQYDFGTKGNLKRYGQKRPPKYHLNNTMTPIAFFVGPGDRVVPRSDVCEAVKQIGNPVLVYDIPFDKYSHTDFILGHNSSELVYKPTYELIRDIDAGNFTKDVNC
ncbi:lipase 3-like [Anthonomus grandis grandis]|uniref:lipase 3-like n=1 Tax=Anthonomus grandis grandis TaxID=2921223 RepID=UPI002166097E|nr:lipase 3-like [Anthonomus grandis grandis]